MKKILALIVPTLVVLGCGGQTAPEPTPADEQPISDTASEAAAPETPPHWGYDADDGPDLWAELSDDWATCGSGQSQSPIDISEVASAADDEPIEASFPPAALRIVHQEHVLEAVDNGHTIQVNYDGGETLTLGDRGYALLQYHFHSPSEHTVDGRHFPMEMHLVHQAESGELAVIGVFVEAGEHNAAFDDVWSNLPTEMGEEVRIEGVEQDVDALLPENVASYRYSGSLTTPPCSEGVSWIILQQPIELGEEQIAAFQEVFEGNNRPTQALNGRTITADLLE